MPYHLQNRHRKNMSCKNYNIICKQKHSNIILPEIILILHERCWNELYPILHTRASFWRAFKTLRNCLLRNHFRFLVLRCISRNLIGKAQTDLYSLFVQIFLQFNKYELTNFYEVDILIKLKINLWKKMFLNIQYFLIKYFTNYIVILNLIIFGKNGDPF